MTLTLVDVKLAIHIFQTHTLASRHSTVAAVLENIETIGVVNAGSTLQMLQVESVKLLVLFIYPCYIYRDLKTKFIKISGEKLVTVQNHWWITMWPALRWWMSK